MNNNEAFMLYLCNQKVLKKLCELDIFINRLENMDVQQCKENPWLEDDCWTQADINNLWMLHYEASTWK